MKLTRYTLKSATQPVTLCPLGDIQWAGDEEDLAYDLLLEHIETCLSLPTPLFIGMGDYIDFASPSNRERLAQARLYNTAKKVIADASKTLVDDLYTRVLKPTRGKWLGLTQGHHHHPVTIKEKNGIATLEDSDAYLTRLLGAEYLDELGLIKLVFPGGGEYHIVAFHGGGSSVFPWGPLNRLYRLAPNFHADLLLMGHQTKKAMGEFDRMIFPSAGPNRLEHMTVKLVGTGGWTKGYIDGKRTYISEAALNPVALGQPLIHLRPRWQRHRGIRTWDNGQTVEV